MLLLPTLFTTQKRLSDGLQTNPLVEDLKQTDVTTYFPAAKKFTELPLSPQSLKGSLTVRL